MHADTGFKSARIETIWGAEAGLEVSAEEDMITLSGLVPGITADSRLVFEAYTLPEHSERILCQALPSEMGTGATASASADGEKTDGRECHRDGGPNRSDALCLSPLSSDP